MCNPKSLRDAQKMLREEVERTARRHWGVKGDTGEESDEELSAREIHHLEGREEGLQWAFDLISKITVRK